MSDEAQAANTEQAPEPPENFEPEAFEFSVEIRMDATVDINGQNWIKPGATTKKTWRIRHGLLPSRVELELATAYMQEGVLKPVLAEMIDLIYQRVAEAQMNR